MTVKTRAATKAIDTVDFIFAADSPVPSAKNRSHSTRAVEQRHCHREQQQDLRNDLPRFAYSRWAWEIKQKKRNRRWIAKDACTFDSHQDIERQSAKNEARETFKLMLERKSLAW